MTAVLDQKITNDYAVYHADNVEAIKGVPNDSVGLIVTSVPFPGMYVYNNTPRDIGNTKDIAEMIGHFGYLAGSEGLLRVTKPGRMCVIHLTQAMAQKGRDGYIGLMDFRGDMIRAMRDAGWVHYFEVTIDKNPQMKAVRTKDRGLLFKSLGNDSSVMRMALADYLIGFMKPGENVDPIRAGISPKYNPGGGWITEDEWCEWAAPVWYRQTKDYPGGIRDTDVLNVAVARENEDERHLCPLQLGVIERCVKLWSNPGDVVLDPFSGIGSTGYRALQLWRKYVGFELKESYYRTGVRNLDRALEGRSSAQLTLPGMADDTPIGEMLAESMV